MAAKVSCYTVVLKENQWIKKAGQKGRGVKKKKEEGRKRKEKGGEERGVRANNRDAQAASWTPITGPDRVSRSETSWREVADQEQDLTQPIREQDFQGPKCMVGPEHDQSESKRTTCTDSVHTHIELAYVTIATSVNHKMNEETSRLQSQSDGFLEFGRVTMTLTVSPTCTRSPKPTDRLSMTRESSLKLIWTKTEMISQ